MRLQARVGRGSRARAGASATLSLLLIALSRPEAAAAGFELERALAAPIASNLVVDRSGTRIGWVVNEAGRRSIQIAVAPKWETRTVASFADDGVAISELEWARAEDQAIFFTRGGDLSFGSEDLPNAGLEPIPPAQRIWRASIAQGAARPVAEGRGAVVSMRDGSVAFIRDHGLFMMSPDGGDIRLALQDKGRVESARWSPDGRKIAFVSRRAGYSFVGVYTLDESSIRYLDPSADTDLDYAWSPDGHHIALLRVPVMGEYRAVRKSCQPFSLRIAEVASGRGSELWRADGGDGSCFSGIDGPRQLAWSESGYLMFAWEKDGWKRLYRLPATGGRPQPITPGSSEVDSATFTTSGNGVAFSSNSGDMDRRHVWWVSAQGEGIPRQLTLGKGIEVSPVPLSDGLSAIACIATDSRHPARVLLREAGGALRELAPRLPSSFPMEELVEPSAAEFFAADGNRVRGQLFLPKGSATASRHPAVVYLHGGPKDQMLLGIHPELYYSHAYMLAQYLVARGFIVLSVNFRSGTGYGLSFRETADYGQYGASDVNDVLGAGLYLRARSDVEGKRIGLWGGSYGGMLTNLGLARASELFAAGVSIHGVYDMRDQSKAHDPFYTLMPAFDPDNKAVDVNRLGFESSAAASVERWRSPVLLIHGDDDHHVPFYNMVRTVEALRRHGVRVEQLVLPNEAHIFLRHASWLEIYGATARFLESELGR